MQIEGCVCYDGARDYIYHAFIFYTTFCTVLPYFKLEIILIIYCNLFRL